MGDSALGQEMLFSECHEIVRMHDLSVIGGLILHLNSQL